MNNKHTLLTIGIICILAFGLSLAVSSALPERIVSHWNLQGQPDDTMARGFALYIFPAVILLLSGLFMLLPAIDPLRENVEKFRPSFNLMIVVFAVYFLFIHILTLLWNLGFRFSMNLVIGPAVAGLIFLIAPLLKKTRRNYFIGIRTPWTLNSDTVWEKTHARAAALFRMTAAFSLLGLLLPDQYFFFLMIPLFCSIIYVLIYSYILYRREIRPVSRPTP